MRKAAALCSVLALLLSATGTAGAVTFDFNSISTGFYSDTDFSNLFSGVSFDNTTGNGFQVQTTSGLQADFSGNAILNYLYTTAGNSTVATFDKLAYFVSVTMGDYNVDADNLYLNAYTLAHNPVGSAFFSSPASSFAGHTLSVNDPSASIAYVEFYGVGSNNNSVYWDNFTFNARENNYVIPEPATISLLGFSLLGWWIGFRKKFRC